MNSSIGLDKSLTRYPIKIASMIKTGVSITIPQISDNTTIKTIHISIYTRLSFIEFIKSNAAIEFYELDINSILYRYWFN